MARKVVLDLQTSSNICGIIDLSDYLHNLVGFSRQYLLPLA